MAAALAAFLCQGAPQQSAETKPPQAPEVTGIPARATPGDYQTHAKAGDVTIAAEFTGHSVATPDAIFTADDYVVVEVALFGSPAKNSLVSYANFSLSLNGKKPEPAKPYELVFHSLKDPNWIPPGGAKQKTSLSSGGGQDDLGSTPAPVHMPFDLERKMDLRVQKATLPEGNRMLPVGGLIFFSHRGKTDNLRSIELIYDGPGGKVTLSLQQ